MVPHHLAAIKGKTNHHLQVTVLLTFLIMYHSLVIVITHSTMYKILKVQYVPSHSYLCYIAQDCTYMVPLLFCGFPGCADYMGYMRDSAWNRNHFPQHSLALHHGWASQQLLLPPCQYRDPVTASYPAPALPQTETSPAAVPTAALQNYTGVNSWLPQHLAKPWV